MANKVIPDYMIPEEYSEVIEVDGKSYLQTNEAMYTFYKRTKGEHSPYFLSLRDRKVIMGATCPKCGLVRVPPFMVYCPDCNFAELELVDMPDVGEMNSTAPITYFANSLFMHLVPFGRGRVMLNGADTALPIHVFTTKGVLTPRIFKKGTLVKVVFRDNRLGKPTDIFAVPQSELTKEQIAKKGLLESELDWSGSIEPVLEQPTDTAAKELAQVVKEMQLLAEKAKTSERAQKDLAGWSRNIAVKTPGGPFVLKIDDGKFWVEPGTTPNPDFVMVAQTAKLFKDWMEFKESLTNAIIAETLWISKNAEFTTVFKLDRVPRSVKRTK